MHVTQMKELALAAIFLMTGCASTNARTGDVDAGIAQLQQKRRAIDESEKKCVDETLQRSDDETAAITATPDASIESQTQKINDARDKEISQCHAWADQEAAQIARQERAEYEIEAQQERNRASFIAVLSTSQFH
jgi:membrane-bound lytic murein transglycosylase